MLEGIVKHNGPMMGPYSDGAPLTPTLADYNGRRDLDLATFAGPEAQAAAIAHDVAYDHPHIDHGLRTGLLTVAALDRVSHLSENRRGRRESVSTCITRGATSN